jgi:hypothetical protein
MPDVWSSAAKIVLVRVMLCVLLGFFRKTRNRRA